MFYDTIGGVNYKITKELIDSHIIVSLESFKDSYKCEIVANFEFITINMLYDSIVQGILEVNISELKLILPVKFKIMQHENVVKLSFNMTHQTKEIQLITELNYTNIDPIEQKFNIESGDSIDLKIFPLPHQWFRCYLDFEINSNKPSKPSYHVNMRLTSANKSIRTFILASGPMWFPVSDQLKIELFKPRYSKFDLILIIDAVV